MEYQKYCENIIERLNEVISDKFQASPNYRYHMVLAIKEYAGDEFESMNDLWDLATKTDQEIKSDIENLIKYFVRQQVTENGLSVEDVKEYYLNTGNPDYYQEPYTSYTDQDWLDLADEYNLER